MSEDKRSLNDYSSVEFEESPCPQGCESSDVFLFNAHDRINSLPGEFTIVECTKCGLVRTNPRPTPDTIGFYYPADYGPYLGTRIEQVRGRLYLVRRFLKKLIDFRAQKIPNMSPGNLLELGCASGNFLKKMSSEGWLVKGVESSPVAAASARESGLDVVTGVAESVSLPENEYDLIVAWMVLEHLHDPIVTLKKLHKSSKPGAVLAISLPNCKHGMRQFKADWFPLHVPNHLYHFTPDTASKLLSRGGWRVYRCMQQRTLIDLPLSIAFSMQSRGRFVPLASGLIRILSGRFGLIYNVVMYPVAFMLSLVNRGTRMTIWAKREDQFPL